jgi:hypothetical protein
MLATLASGCAPLVSWSQYGPSSDAGANADAGVPCSEYDAGTCESKCCNAHPTSDNEYEAAYSACVCTVAVCESVCSDTDCSNAADAASAAVGSACYDCESKAELPSGACPPMMLCGNSTQASDCMALANCYNNCPY